MQAVQKKLIFEEKKYSSHRNFQDEMIVYMYNNLITTKRGSSAGRAAKEV